MLWFAVLLAAIAEVPDPADLQNLLTNDNYPPAALEAGEQGTVGIEVEVAAGGKPLRCQVVRGSGSALLDRETCALVMARGNFVASARRHPGKSFTLDLTVRWSIEHGVPVPFQASAARKVFAVEGGRTGACREERVAGPMTISNPCDVFRPLADPQLAGLAARGALKSPVEWVFEVGMIIGNSAGPAPGERPRELLLTRQAQHLTIADDGSVIDCETAAVGTEPDPRECVLIRQNQRFIPRTAAPNAPLRKAAQYSVSYIRPARPR